MKFSKDLLSVVEIAEQAGKIVLQYYQNTDLNIELKSDESPVTRADRESSEFIVSQLQVFSTDIPIISEEDEIPDWKERSNWSSFWLVDPLDGTKDFIRGGKDFCINIALIQEGVPVLGVIHDPLGDCSYLAEKSFGSWKKVTNNYEKIFSSERKLDQPLRLLVSRSHELKIPEELSSRIQIEKTIRRGSALKFCTLSEGEADLYLRFGPCMEWDVAAGDCLFRNSALKGFRISPFRYNTKTLRVDGFALGVDQLSRSFQV